MGLFEKKDGSEDVKTEAKAEATSEIEAKNEEQAASQDYLDDYAGAGLDSLVDGVTSTAYLGLVQPSSTVSEEHIPGTWRNSATDENYGPVVNVIVLAFKTIWVERNKDSPYNTIAMYEPNGIEVEITYPETGARGFPKMTNPKTKNEIQESFIYACMRPEALDEGIIYFSPTVISLKTCRQWNMQLRSQRLPSGKPAPIFACIWELEAGLVQNPKRPDNAKEKVARFMRVSKIGLIERKQFTVVKPQLESGISQKIALITANTIPPEETV